MDLINATPNSQINSLTPGRTRKPCCNRVILQVQIFKGAWLLFWASPEKLTKGALEDLSGDNFNIGTREWLGAITDEAMSHYWYCKKFNDLASVACIPRAQWVNSRITSSRIILWMRPANGRRRYMVTSSLIGWAHSQNDPCILNHCVAEMNPNNNTTNPAGVGHQIFKWNQVIPCLLMPWRFLALARGWGYYSSHDCQGWF